MYFTVRGSLTCLKRSTILSRNHGPTSANFLLPPPSTSPELFSKVSPHPSATTTRQWPLDCISSRMCRKTFSRLISISGSITMSAWRAARPACRAMKPECRPISFTKPTQLALQVASTYPALMARSASIHAVSKPKVQSSIGMSLSMVLGIPTTEQFQFFATMRSAHSWAPRCVPSPPMMKCARTPMSISTCTCSSSVGLPRSLTRMVPPIELMSCTLSGVSSIHISGLTTPL
mmetsp:Transcript_133087/g.315490  ORF Transcript_133087/g.315490 Transcript_133087/m.315490 type:complete len:233 (+) Transcript_133087:780-1478(+)